MTRVISDDADALLSLLQVGEVPAAVRTLAETQLGALHARAGGGYNDILYHTQRLWLEFAPAERFACQADLDAQVRVWMSLSQLVERGLPMGDGWLCGRINEAFDSVGTKRGRPAAAQLSRALQALITKLGMQAQPAVKSSPGAATEPAAQMVQVTAEPVDGGRFLITATAGNETARTWLVRKDWPRKIVDQTRMAGRIATLLSSNLPALDAPGVNGSELIRQAILSALKPPKATPGMAA